MAGGGEWGSSCLRHYGAFCTKIDVTRPLRMKDGECLLERVCVRSRNIIISLVLFSRSRTVIF